MAAAADVPSDALSVQLEECVHINTYIHFYINVYT